MDASAGYLRKILLLLHAEQARDWSPQRREWRVRESRIPKIAQEVREKLIDQGWWPVSEEELNRWLSAENGLHVDFSEKQKVLYLPALEKDSNFVPVLSLKANFDKDGDKKRKQRKEIRLRVMLVSRGEEHDTFRGIGFRLDSPESGNVADEAKEGDSPDKDEDGNKGRHDFYHAQLQLIRGFDWGPRIELPGWLPCNQPSFPLTADDPITLVLSLLLTLYGKKYCGRFLQRHSGNLSMLKTAERKLQTWIQWKEHD